MEIEFRPSAFRHRISQARARYVIEHCPMPLYEPPVSERADLVLFLGLDPNGVPLEVVAVELTDRGLLAIHAMKMRTRYREALEMVMGWPRKS
ncbi:MAG TPA: toxin [Candidatus Limnocylindria bacterium]|nr:toxin [Candidatus Limnocylindria bacterium]